MRMSILDLQKRLHEDGRIRIGQQVATGNGRKRPAKLDRFRFTSQSKRAIEAVAQLYGGAVQQWADAPMGEQWEVVTEVTEFPVVLGPETISFSQAYELWSGGGCKRRCDGEHETISDGPCLCDPEKRECKPHTRLSLMLADRPGAGLWRLDSTGWYAATELAGAIELAGMLTAHLGRQLLPARLRLEEKAVKRPNPKNPDATITLKFGVPVLDFDLDLRALAAGTPALASAPSIAALPTPASIEAAPSSPVTPVPAQPAPSLAEQIASVEAAPTGTRRKNAPPLIPSTGLAPRTAAQAEAGTPPAQQEPLSAVAPAGKDEGEEEGTPPAPASSPSSTPARRRRRAADSAAAPSAPATAERKPGCITQQRAHELVTEAEEFFPDRQTRLLYATEIVGREITSFSELTTQEGNKLARAFNDERRQKAGQHEGDDS